MVTQCKCRRAATVLLVHELLVSSKLVTVVAEVVFCAAPTK